MMGWMPGATRMPGRNAGYRAGHVSRQSVVCHYTVGRNSAGIGVQGYFNFLVRRNGEIVQFAESDAVCWHAGNWNSRGPGIEVEYHEGYDGAHPGNIFTPAQLAACGRVVRWLHETDGYPLDFHDGGRVTSHRGFITHRSLIQTGDAHHDYWSHDQWERMAGTPAPPPPPPKGHQMFAVHLLEAPGQGWPHGAFFVGTVGSWRGGDQPDDLARWQKAIDEGHFEVTENGRTWDLFNKQLKPDGGTPIAR